MSDDKLKALEEAGLTNAQAKELLAQAGSDGDALKLLGAGFTLVQACEIADAITDAHFLRKPLRAERLGGNSEVAEAISAAVNSSIPPARVGTSA